MEYTYWCSTLLRIWRRIIIGVALPSEMGYNPWLNTKFGSGKYHRNDGGQDPVAPLKVRTQDNRLSPFIPNPDAYVSGFFTTSSWFASETGWFKSGTLTVTIKYRGILWRVIQMSPPSGKCIKKKKISPEEISSHCTTSHVGQPPLRGAGVCIGVNPSWRTEP